jgi:hypothetical protein
MMMMQTNVMKVLMMIIAIIATMIAIIIAVRLRGGDDDDVVSEYFGRLVRIYRAQVGVSQLARINNGRRLFIANTASAIRRCRCC